MKPFYAAVPPETKQIDTIFLSLSKQGRSGKTVTVLSRLQMHPAGKASLLKTLKIACGAGGTIKDGALEIQGEQRAKVKVLLEKAGYKVKGFN